MTGRFDFEGVLESLADEDADRSSARGASQSPVSKFGGAAAPLGVALNPTYGDAVRREGELSAAGPSRSDPVDLPARSPQPPRDAKQIEFELALSDDMSAREIGRRRRQFLWEHHPDRSGAGPEAAHNESAIANMLFDRAILKRRRK